MELSDKELLNFAIENGIIDVSDIQQKIEMNERNRYIENHNYSIWQSKDGKFYTYLPDEKYNRGKRLIKRTTEQALNDAIVQFYKERENEPYIEDVFDEWLDRKLKYGEIEKQTADRYKTDFIKYIKNSHIAQIKFRYITEDDLEDFIRTTIKEKQLTSKAWGNLRTLINGIFKRGKKRGLTSISITSFIGDLEISDKSFKKTYTSSEEQVFTDSEEAKIKWCINAEHDSLLGLGILLTFQTGLRSGELSALMWKDVKEDSISITKTEIRYRDEDGNYVFDVRDAPKTKAGYRTVYLTPEGKMIIKRIRALNPFNDYLFFKDGQRIKGYLFSRKLYRICNKLGIKKRSLHKIRKTYSTKLIDAHVPDSVIENQMGHEDIETTKKYYYFNNHGRDEVKELVMNALCRKGNTGNTLKS